jgi:hypothetical protein
LIGVPQSCAVTIVNQVRHAIGYHEKIARKGDHKRSGTVIGSAIGIGLESLGMDCSILFHSCLYGHVHGMPLLGCDEDLFPLVYELNGPSKVPGKPTGTKVFCKHVNLSAKPTSHLGFDDPDLNFWDKERGGKVSSQEEGDQDGRPNADFAG